MERQVKEDFAVEQFCRIIRTLRALGPNEMLLLPLFCALLTLAAQAQLPTAPNPNANTNNSDESNRPTASAQSQMNQNPSPFLSSVPLAKLRQKPSRSRCSMPSIAG